MDASRRPRGPRRSVRARRVVPWALVVLVVGPLVAACGAAGTGSSSDAAADAVAEAFVLPDDARACLVGRFSSDSTARDLINSAAEPTVAERTALAEAVDACMTRDQFAAAMAARITVQLPPPDSAGTATQIDCLTTALLGFSQTDHEDLVVGLLVLSAPPTGDLALARSEVVNALNSNCGITPPG